MDRVFQKTRILDALRDNPQGLTTRDLERASDSTNVTGRISELRKDGHRILNLRGAIVRRGKKYNAWILYRESYHAKGTDRAGAGQARSA